MDSTGIAVVQDVEKAPFVYKKALSGPDFIQMGQFDRILFDIEKFPIALGHNRSSTRGMVTDHNAHPFQYGHITLVHNGHIHNADTLPNAKEADCAVDSAKVAYSMFKNGEMETLEMIEGTFVLVWWNSKTQKLNMARNDKRPLWMGYVDKENTMLWASEALMLAWLVERNGGTLEDDTVIYPEISTWYKYDLKDLRKIEKVPFALSQGRRYNQQGHGTGNTSGATTEPWPSGVDMEAWEAEEEAYEAWKAGTSVAEEISQTPSGGTKRSPMVWSGSGAAELDEIRQGLSNQRDKEAKQNGLPTSKRKINRATQDLRKMNVKYREMMACTPVSWTKYPNQQHLGFLMARSRKGGYNVQVIGIHESDFSKFHDKGCVLVDICNVKKDEKGRVYLIGNIHPKMADLLAADANNQELLQESINKEREVELLYDGPGGRRISLAKFVESVKEGCGWCSESIRPDDHSLVLWMADGSAVCATCAKDPQILADIGASITIPGNARHSAELH